MEKLYRKNYTGEFFIHSRNYVNGKIRETREWVPSTIPEFAHTGNAVVIGNGPSRLDLNLVHIANHRGGWQGHRRLTSYGCNALYRDMAPNFLIATGDVITEEINNAGYDQKNIVYSHANLITKYPGSFHLIPYDRYWNAGTTATWLACFDGHKKVYLLGFDNQVNKNMNRNVYLNTPGYGVATDNVDDTNWVSTMYDIFTTYNDVEFVWVNPTSMPEQWKYANNLRQISIRNFSIEADLGA